MEAGEDRGLRPQQRKTSFFMHEMLKREDHCAEGTGNSSKGQKQIVYFVHYCINNIPKDTHLVNPASIF